MPIVRIELLAGRTKEQKAAAAKQITEVVQATLGASPESTQVIFTEVEKRHWAKAGVLFDPT